MAEDDWVVPSDEALRKAFGRTVRRLREEAGLTLEEAEARMVAASKEIDHKAVRRALGAAIRSCREQRKMSRKQLAEIAKITVRRLVLIERGAVSSDLGEFFRLSYGMKIFPDQLWARFEQLFGEIEGKPLNTEV